MLCYLFLETKILLTFREPAFKIGRETLQSEQSKQKTKQSEVHSAVWAMGQRRVSHGAENRTNTQQDRDGELEERFL